MIRIGVRELRQHASRYLERVKAGETIEVAERGELVALLSPPGPAVGARDRLVRSGGLAAATAPFELPKRAPIKAGRPSTSDALEELREELL